MLRTILVPTEKACSFLLGNFWYWRASDSWTRTSLLNCLCSFGVSAEDMGVILSASGRRKGRGGEGGRILEGQKGHRPIVLSACSDVNWQWTPAPGNSIASGLSPTLLNKLNVCAPFSGPHSVIWIWNGSCVETRLCYVDLIPVFKNADSKPFVTNPQQ